MPSRRPNFRQFPRLMLTRMAHPENIDSLWCPVQCWQSSAYSLVLFGQPKTWDTRHMACCECGLSHVSLPISKTAGEKKHLSCSQAGSIYGENLCKFSRKLVVPDEKGRLIPCFVCVCSHPSSSALCYSLRINFFFCLLS